MERFRNRPLQRRFRRWPQTRRENIREALEHVALEHARKFNAKVLEDSLNLLKNGIQGLIRSRRSKEALCDLTKASLRKSGVPVSYLKSA